MRPCDQCCPTFAQMVRRAETEGVLVLAYEIVWQLEGGGRAYWGRRLPVVYGEGVGHEVDAEHLARVLHFNATDPRTHHKKSPAKAAAAAKSPAKKSAATAAAEQAAAEAAEEAAAEAAEAVAATPPRTRAGRGGASGAKRQLASRRSKRSVANSSSASEGDDGTDDDYDGCA